MNINISIPNKGYLVGTCGWVKNKLEKAEYKISNTKDGCIALFVKFAGNDKWKLICFYTSPNDESAMFMYQEYIERYYHVYAQDVSYNDDRICLFDNLTDAALEYSEQFIAMCCDKLIEFIENDDEIKMNLKLIEI